MQQFFSYWLWPNPAGWHYGDTRVLTFIIIAVLLVIASFVIGRIRSSRTNPITRSLMTSWPSASFWFGVSALVLIVSRVETIQFLSMRLLWIVWVLFLFLFVLFQFLQFRRRHYTVVGRTQIIDEREKYLPRKKR